MMLRIKTIATFLAVLILATVVCQAGIVSKDTADMKLVYYDTPFRSIMTPVPNMTGADLAYTLIAVQSLRPDVDEFDVLVRYQILPGVSIDKTTTVARSKAQTYTAVVVFLPAEAKILAVTVTAKSKVAEISTEEGR